GRGSADRDLERERVADDTPLARVERAARDRNRVDVRRPDAQRRRGPPAQVDLGLHLVQRQEDFHSANAGVRHARGAQPATRECATGCARHGASSRDSAILHHGMAAAPGPSATMDIQTNVSRPDPKALRILAKSIFKELRAQGYTPQQILSFATEIVSLVTSEIAHDSDSTR